MSQTGIYHKTQRQGEPSVSISVLGIDIGKNNFHPFGVDANGKKAFRNKLTREKLTEFIPTLEPCLIVMEACGGAHYWARYFHSCDHQVKLIAPQYVKMYVKTNTYEPSVCQGK